MVTAHTVDARATTHPKRPAWSDMYKHYPGESIRPEYFYPMISKAYYELWKKDPDSFENTCAARMSYALNRSGMKLPYNTNGGVYKGDDGLNYWIRVSELKPLLFKHFGKGDFEQASPQFEKIAQKRLDEKFKSGQKLLEKIIGKHGIIVFDVRGWRGATGHFTLWDGEHLVYTGDPAHDSTTSPEYYFWYMREGKPGLIGSQLTKTTFWELK